MRFALALAFLALLLAPAAHAHESRPAYLELREVAPGRYELLWRTPTFSGMPLPVSLALPADLVDVAPPRSRTLPDSRIEQRVLERAGGLAGQRIEFPGLQATITDVLVRVQTLDGSSTVIVRPAQPWVEIPASQGTWAVIGTYLVHGIEHILLGADHLLFVFGLMLIVRDRWQLLQAITAFTVAHSLTLAIATLGLAAAPVVPLNAAIALSILFLGPEIVRAGRGGTSLTIRRPWLVAFAFGLLHGFGFAGALTSAGLPRADLPLALLGFNLGVEVGQVAFVLLVLLLERSFHQLEIRWPRWAELLPGYAVGSLGAFWVIQRTWILVGALAVACVLALPATAFAHGRGGEALGFTSGLLHPISGLDHVLAMIAVGLWGAQLGAPALWLLPVTFPMVMAFGGMLGLLGVALPGIEIGIALSAVALGAAVFSEARPRLWVAAVVVGFFAIFHGHAHGTELPSGADGVLYSLGFVTATGLLHATGITTGLIHRFPAGRVALRGAGAVVALAGVAFLWRAIA